MLGPYLMVKASDEKENGEGGEDQKPEIRSSNGKLWCDEEDLGKHSNACGSGFGGGTGAYGYYCNEGIGRCQCWNCGCLPENHDINDVPGEPCPLDGCPGVMMDKQTGEGHPKENEQ